MTRWILVAVTVAIASGVLCWLRWRYLVVAVAGRSMEPTYVAGDRLLVRRTRTDRIRRGQVVVFAKTPPANGGAPGGARDDLREAPWIIKRAVAVPGDPVPTPAVPALRGSAGARVPPGHLVVLGDNAERSFDSRSFGYLTADLVFGVVLRRIADPVAEAGRPAALRPHDREASTAYPK